MNNCIIFFVSVALRTGEINCYISLPWSHINSPSNIALKRPTRLSCSLEVVDDNVINDGDTEQTNFVEVLNDCKFDKLIGVSVFLVPHSKNIIGSVTLYSGDCKDCDDLLDNFNVVLLVDVQGSTTNYTGSESRKCGQYQGRYLGPGLPNRVNCDLNGSHGYMVMMVTVNPNSRQLKMSIKASIAEIEINELEYSHTPAYYGCYEEFKSDIVRTDGTIKCRMTCFTRGHRFMSLSIDDICRCGSVVPSQVDLDDTNCLNECTGEDVICSNGTHHAVYIAKPPHMFSVGCYRLQEPTGIANNNNLSLIDCIMKCSEQRMKYAYKKTSTCHCKNSLTEPLQVHLCNGNCGGELCIEAALVYSGCIDIETQSPCQDVYKCKDDDFDEFGKCRGQCEDGWYGDYCISREIAKSHGRPSPILHPKRRIRRSISDTDGEPPILIGDFNVTHNMLLAQHTGTIQPECQKLIKEFIRARKDQMQATFGPVDRDCVKAIEEGSKAKDYVSVLTVVISVVVSTIVFTAIGVASGLMYSKLVRGELVMADTAVIEESN